MKIHILGICGTFMGSLAVLARQLGHEVSGCDANVYPPMSTQLASQGIQLLEGYEPGHLVPAPDLVIIGNAMSRGNPCVEYVLNQGLPYISGPQWLAEQVLKDRWVLAVAGTHGKTTTTSMLTWILQRAGIRAGYLIGGVPLGPGGDASADLGDSPFFVIEADEYDSAFFDKRSKFIHYRPRTLILNNLEFDHADIFDSVTDIQKQFHYLLRTVPGNGRIIYPGHEKYLREVIEQGCWSEQEALSLEEDGALWRASLIKDDGSVFTVYLENKKQGEVSWNHHGVHNVCNGLAAVAAARHTGVAPEHAIAALNDFPGVKRRMEKIYDCGNTCIYDDFAHHPTAIYTTLDGLRKQVGDEQIVAVIEPRSNTMRMGIHRSSLIQSADSADQVIWFQPADSQLDLEALLGSAVNVQQVENNIEQIVDRLCAYVQASKEHRIHIVIMSNGAFGGIHQKLIATLSAVN
jgi:UDP-N-acetylmuramate: L-alanyl-gamma-D-glutamyl-meso-diaminopimelate ligase